MGSPNGQHVAFDVVVIDRGGLRDDAENRDVPVAVRRVETARHTGGSASQAACTEPHSVLPGRYRRPTPATHDPLAVPNRYELTLVYRGIRLKRRLVPNFRLCAPFTQLKSLTMLWVGVSRPLLDVERHEVVDEAEAVHVVVEQPDGVFLDLGEAIPQRVHLVGPEHPVVSDGEAAAVDFARGLRWLIGELLRAQDRVVLEIESAEQVLARRRVEVDPRDVGLEVVLDGRGEAIAHDVVAVAAGVVGRRILLEQFRGRAAGPDAERVDRAQRVGAEAVEAGRDAVRLAEAGDRAAGARRGDRASIEHARRR